jgi:hypothetical protein
MKFQIDFNERNDDKFLIDVLGCYLVPTGSTKYPPFEVLMIDLKDFNDLKDILEKVDNKFGCLSSAIISYDPATIYIDF